VLLYGGWLAVHDQASVGTIVSFNAYVLLLQPPFRLLGQLMMMGQRAKASAGRIYEVLDERPDIVDRPGAVDLVTARGDVHFDDVHFAYANGTEVLRGFDLRLRPGETVALVGRTGSGKSTVARLLGRNYDVTGGAVVVDGHDVRDLTLASLRHHVGWWPTSRSSSPSRSATTWPTVGPTPPTRTSTPPPWRPAPTASSGPARGLRHGRGGAGLHALGRAAPAHLDRPHPGAQPPILVLDDATSAIDVQVEQQIHEALRGLLASARR